MFCGQPNWSGLVVVTAALALVLALAPFVPPRTEIHMVVEHAPAGGLRG
jgi:hypothetical protein